MGFDLYRMLRAGMPPEWSQGERLVALIVADACNDRTGQGYISNKQLCDETGYTPGSLSKVFRRLSQRGYEMRVPHGLGDDGRPVFATRGHGTDYCVPMLKPRPTLALCGPEKGRADARPSEKGRVSGRKGRVSGRESPSEDSPPTPITPSTHNNHQGSVVTPSVEGRALVDLGGAARQPIERQTFEWFMQQRKG